ncbi:hypothetical protein LMIV_0694 [Listeria monocytogenes FSL J1-208]|uniref:hypothetical protein n=1 Tax=Listeria monocytogenes TaxID=1639 RepID=UPI0002548636|nr:hypothetical protein [Listeria monocytogenes]EAE5920912.1 hypothetical protein [Listeria monocytogenes]EAG6686545.1 hypothetical protein [Listeria monocytogenes]EHY63237.1 hypothetical protein LMIV_0694 [Listeria monocytogenes FSL J1-208]OEO46502.1 hypothetical protein AJZ74_09130 [Listeria monocytogenes]QOF63217.1 hypothetical protein IFI77_04580 [Listeria monocytogenes FSL J1-208]
MKNKVGIIAGAVGAVAGVITCAAIYVVKKQQPPTPFDEVNDIRTRYEDKEISETELEENNMISEGGVSSIQYEEKVK